MRKFLLFLSLIVAMVCKAQTKQELLPATDNGSLFYGGSAIEPTVHCETDDWFQYAISHCRNVTVLHVNHRDDGVFRFKLLAEYQPMFR